MNPPMPSGYSVKYLRDVSGLGQASSEEPGHVTIGGKRKVPNSNLPIYQGANVDLRRFQTALDNNLLHSQ